MFILVVAGVAIVPLVSGQLAHRGYAQVAQPQGDEFNNTSFTAPFQVQCGAYATPPCPDAQSPTSWNLDTTHPGYLEIQTLFGSLVGTPQQSSDNARNFVVEPFDPLYDWTVTTSMTFPGLATNTTPLGQTAGLLVYGNDENFIYFGRVLDPSGQVNLQFLQEQNGVDVVNTAPEQGFSLHPTIYLRLIKQDTLYRAQYSYDNVGFTDFAPGAPATTTPTATATSTPTATPTGTSMTTPTATDTPTPTSTPTPAPIGYTATYTTPKVGMFAWGGLNAAVVGATVPADFEWFRTGNSQIPAPTATPTSTPTATATGTSVPTNTSTPTATETPVPTSTTTAVPTNTPTATSTPTSTATSTPAPTNTPTTAPVPTPTPQPVVHQAAASFSYSSVWYHVIRMGTQETIQAQNAQHAVEGIWVHIFFGSGYHMDFYQNTDKNGFWQQSFKIPANAVGKYSSEAVVTFQLWHGKSTAKSFETFTAIK
jgi:hypothetical protein